MIIMSDIELQIGQVCDGNTGKLADLSKEWNWNFKFQVLGISTSEEYIRFVESLGEKVTPPLQNYFYKVSMD